MVELAITMQKEPMPKTLDIYYEEMKWWEFLDELLENPAKLNFNGYGFPQLKEFKSLHSVIAENKYNEKKQRRDKIESKMSRQEAKKAFNAIKKRLQAKMNKQPEPKQAVSINWDN